MAEPTDQSFDDVVAECAERLDREGAAALEAMCALHPEHAAALRRAMAPLRSTAPIPDAPASQEPLRLEIEK